MIFPETNSLSRPHVFRDILMVGSPILLLAASGTLLGLETLAGGAVVNLGYALAIISGGFLLKFQGSSWRMIGLSKPENWWNTALKGMGAWIGAVIIFVLMQVLIITLLTMLELPSQAIDESRFNPLAGNLPMLLFMVALAWTTIAFGEELFYRAFLISRLVDQAAMSRKAAITLSALAFGAAHFAEGPMGIISNGAFGVFFGWIYLKSKRNLWITVIGHGLLNTFRFILLYTGAA
ncbi:MAG TPA: type II CAAX endopeptidase family protein [Pontiella sp.]|nr:type II CAAX endopeptidase family protein [Pontiella sp.]